MPAPAPSELTFYLKWGDLCEKWDWCGLVLRSAYFSASPYPLPRSLVLYLIRYASDPSSAQGSTVHATLAPLPLSSMFLLPVSVPALCGRCGASAAVLLFCLDLLQQQSTAMTVHPAAPSGKRRKLRACPRSLPAAAALDLSPAFWIYCNHRS